MPETTIGRLALKLSGFPTLDGERLARRVGDGLAAAIRRATAVNASELKLRAAAAGDEDESQLAELIVDTILKELTPKQ